MPNFHCIPLFSLSRLGFVVDPSSIPSDTEEFLSPRFDSPHEFITSQLYVHHSGCSLIQPICEHTHTHQPCSVETSNWRHISVASHSSQPLDTSTPFGSPRDSIKTLSPNLSSETRCGFNWYRNFLLTKQNAPTSQLTQYNTVFNEFVALCSNSNGQLSDICIQLFDGQNV